MSEQSNGNLNYSDEDMKNLVSKEKFESTKKMILDNPSFIDDNLDYLNHRIMDRACFYGNFELVKFIYDIKQDSIHYISANTETDALKAACFEGHKEIIDFLIEKGSSFSQRYFFNRTHPLYFVISSHHYELAKYLMGKYNMTVNDKISKTRQRLWTIPMTEYEIIDPPEVKKGKIEFFKWCTAQLKPGELLSDSQNWLVKSMNYDREHAFFDELIRLKAPFEEWYSPSWACNPVAEALKVDDDYAIKILLKNFPSLDTRLPETTRINIISKYYSSLNYKWRRLLDIYYLRYFFELKAGQLTCGNSKIIEDKNFNDCYSAIEKQKGKPSLALLKVNRRVFSSAMKMIPTIDTPIHENNY